LQPPDVTSELAPNGQNGQRIRKGGKIYIYIYIYMRPPMMLCRGK
jgi:hypothetical protein